MPAGVGTTTEQSETISPAYKQVLQGVEAARQAILSATDTQTTLWALERAYDCVADAARSLTRYERDRLRGLLVRIDTYVCPTPPDRRCDRCAEHGYLSAPCSSCGGSGEVRRDGHARCCPACHSLGSQRQDCPGCPGGRSTGSTPEQWADWRSDILHGSGLASVR